MCLSSLSRYFVLLLHKLTFLIIILTSQTDVSILPLQVWEMFKNISCTEKKCFKCCFLILILWLPVNSTVIRNAHLDTGIQASVSIDSLNSTQIMFSLFQIFPVNSGKKKKNKKNQDEKTALVNIIHYLCHVGVGIHSHFSEIMYILLASLHIYLPAEHCKYSLFCFVLFWRNFCRKFVHLSLWCLQFVQKLL